LGLCHRDYTFALLRRFSMMMPTTTAMKGTIQIFERCYDAGQDAVGERFEAVLAVRHRK